MIEAPVQETNDIIEPMEEVPLMNTPEPLLTTRAGRITGPPSHLQDFVVYEATTNLSTIVPDIDCMLPLAFTASSDPDVLYYHEAMAAHDHVQFRKAMEEEIQGQTNNGNWKVIQRSSISKHTRVLPAIWAMRCK
jgi:hypothetical protein